MKSNKAGFQERKSEPSSIDVAFGLVDLPVEFLSFAEARASALTDYRVVTGRMSRDHTHLKKMVKSLSPDGTYVANNTFAASVNSRLAEARVCHASQKKKRTGGHDDGKPGGHLHRWQQSLPRLARQLQPR